MTPVLRRRRLVLGVAAVVLVVDQLSKWWALERLDDGRIIDVIWTFRFRLAFNSGTAFSQGEGLGWLIGIVALAMSVVLVIWGGRVDSVAQRVAIGGVLGGAIGNLADRAFRGDDGPLSGSVVDFFDFQWWPVFNVADIGITLGVIVLVLLLAREDAQLRVAEQPAGPNQARAAETDVPEVGAVESAEAGVEAAELEGAEPAETEDPRQAAGADPGGGGGIRGLGEVTEEPT